MNKNLLISFFVVISSMPCLAFEVSSDTSMGGLSFTEALSADGDFGNLDRRGRVQSDNRVKSVWSADYTFTRTTTTNATGDAVVDNTNEIDLGIGKEKKKSFEYGGGIIYANTPDENLKDIGANIYGGHTFGLSEKSGDSFVPTLGLKMTLTLISYVQTFGSSTTSRTGKLKPTTGTSSITQFAPKIEMPIDFWESLSFKLIYTYFFYNRNVSDFLQTLDSPRAVAVGIYGLTNTVSGFYSNQTEFDINWYPIDNWELDQDTTQATSALDGTSTWTSKEALLYDINKNWNVGLAFQYETSSTLTDHIYSITFKYTAN